MTCNVCKISQTDSTKLALREGHDVLDSAITYSGTNTYNYLYIRPSEYTGTTYDPYLTVSYSYPDTTTSTTTSETTYTYNHAGQRVSKTSGSMTTYYPSSDYSVEGGVSTIYVNGPSGLVTSIENNGVASTTSTLHTDHLGSTSVATDEDGIMIELLDYHPYGTERISWSSSSTDGSAESQKTYIGEYSDNESGLSYLNARYYDPERGQFLSQDSVYLSLGSGIDKREQVALLDPQMQNSYAYARNNPVKHTDPDGEFIPLLVAAYLGVQVTLSAWDIYSTYETFQDPNSSDTAKALAFGLTFWGVVDPWGGGYTGAGKAIGKGADVLKGVVNPRTLLFRQGPDEMTSKYVDELAEDMKRNGFDFDHPIDVYKIGDDLYIRDGHHRAEAAIQSGIKEVPVNITEVTDPSEASRIISDWAEAGQK